MSQLLGLKATAIFDPRRSIERYAFGAFEVFTLAEGLCGRAGQRRPRPRQHDIDQLPEVLQTGKPSRQDDQRHSVNSRPNREARVAIVRAPLEKKRLSISSPHPRPQATAESV